MKINQFFDKGYYLNLDRRPDRREHIENVIKQAGLESFFERVPAIDCNSEQDPVRKKRLVEEPLFRHSYCGASIHSILKDIKEKGYERALLLEDDMDFYDGGSEPGLQIIEKALDQLQNLPDWEIVYFSGYIIDKEVEQVTENLVKANTVLTTHAIGFNKTAIDKMLAYVPFKDSAIDGWIGQRTNTVKYVVWPLSSYQKDVGISDLDAWGYNPGLKNWLDSYSKVNIVKK